MEISNDTLLAIQKLGRVIFGPKVIEAFWATRRQIAFACTAACIFSGEALHKGFRS